MIHISQIHKEIQMLPDFSLVFVSKNGEIITGKKCICTSFFSNGRTINIKFIDSGQIRKIRRVSLIEFNGQKVVL